MSKHRNHHDEKNVPEENPSINETTPTSKVDEIEGDSAVDKESFFKKLSEKNADQETDKLAKELEDMKVLLQRNQAEFLNYKKRTEKEKEDLKYLANEKLMLDLLGVLDNFERALAAFEDKENPMCQGVELICKQLWDAMCKHGASEIDNQGSFDPAFHHAVMQEEGGESGHIAKVLQKGYLLKDRVLRPSMVSVYQ